MGGDLFCSALGGDVLGVQQLRPSGGSSEGDEIVGDHRYGASRALFPRRVGRRIDDHLTDDPPARVMGIAPRDKKARERVGDLWGVGIGRVAIEMTQRRADIAAAVHRPCQVACGWPWSFACSVDLPTVLAAPVQIAILAAPIAPR